MARFGIQMLGDTDLEATLAGLTDQIERKVLGQALRDAAQFIREDAQRRAPVRSGRLRDTLAVRTLKRSRRRVGFGIWTGTREQLGIPAQAQGYYPAAVHLGYTVGRRRQRVQALRQGARRLLQAEFGTRHIPARPFLRPALIANRDAVLALIGARLRERLAARGL